MKLAKAKSLKEIAELVNVSIVGNPDISVKGINEIHKVVEGDITFVDNPKYYKRALASKAAAVLINEEISSPNGKAMLLTDHPFNAYNTLVNHFAPFKESDKSISDTAKIGEGTLIQPHVFIGNDVTIGKNCLIHPNVAIYDGAIIGNNVIIQANTVLGSDAFYFKTENNKHNKMLSCGSLIIEDDVEIGSGCTLDRGVSGATIIGEGTKIDNLVHVGHGTVIGKNCLFAAQVGIGGKVNIEDNVILWGQVGISKDLTIGKNTVVLAQSGVVKSLDPDKVYFGSPVLEAREKMKELAIMKDLPAIWDRIKEG